MKLSLFDPIQLGSVTLKNRIVMAPMTRSRASQPGNIPNDLMATYYAQRATAGLIISEGTPISAVARGYSLTPGIYTEQQIAGWRKVTHAVHKRGGKIFAQLWHVGRRSSTAIEGLQPLAPSAIKEPDKVYGPLPNGELGMIDTTMPKAMDLSDIQNTVNDFVIAAKNAMRAGFDGVEIHGAHGYLLDQFMRRYANTRDDKYGGSIENRIRLTIDVCQAVANAIGSDKVGLRISPFVSSSFRQHDSDMPTLTLALLKALAPIKLAYLHLSENIGNYQPITDTYRKKIRSLYPHPIMLAGGLTQELANCFLNKGMADLFAFGTAYICNPDLVERMKGNMPLTQLANDAHSTFYGGGEKGYTDYPTSCSFAQKSVR
ncbi:alkene reductase [Pseudoalteromonas spongiae]|uniref:alkene reductase n=1 Tax=Pseudoalteromonas spongiae TaxID=298657 RepID=UPI00110A5A22|nr:alkene reductase [Pseudoalteromonas spongiae]TMO83512.1 alkene reductase [Pseudoalteromonas spongiae]